MTWSPSTGFTLVVAVLVAVQAPAGLAIPTSSQTPWRATHCYYGDDPGRSLSLPLPAGHSLQLMRSTDSVAEGRAECMASVRDTRGAEVWQATGFGAGMEAWTGSRTIRRMPSRWPSKTRA